MASMLNLVPAPTVVDYTTNAPRFRCCLIRLVAYATQLLNTPDCRWTTSHNASASAMCLTFAARLLNGPGRHRRNGVKTSVRQQTSNIIKFVANQSPYAGSANRLRDPTPTPVTSRFD